MTVKKQKKPKTKKPPAFCVINQYGEHKIEGTYYGLIIRLSGSTQEAKLIFFRARHTKDPVKWIRAGIKKGYALNRVKEEFDNKDEVQQWIDLTINRFVKEPEKRRMGSQKVDKLNTLINDIVPQL